MYRLIDLMRRRKRINIDMPRSFDELISWSLAMNPMNGGTPAREARPTRYFHEFHPSI